MRGNSTGPRDEKRTVAAEGCAAQARQVTAMFIRAPSKGINSAIGLEPHGVSITLIRRFVAAVLRKMEAGVREARHRNHKLLVSGNLLDALDGQRDGVCAAAGVRVVNPSASLLGSIAEIPMVGNRRNRATVR